MWLSLTLAGVSLVSGYLGFHVTSAVPGSLKHPRWWRAAFIACCLASIALLALQQMDQQAEARENRNAQAALRADLDRLIQQMARPPQVDVNALARALAESNRILDEASKEPAGELKRTVARLSAEILEFVAERQRGEPIWIPRPDQSPESRQQEIENHLRYGEETRGEYVVRFAARVKDARDRLALRGLRDKEVDLSSQYPPVNPLVMVELGTQLSVLAAKLN